MLRREYLTLKRRLQCGDLSCFLACCSQIPALLEAFQSLSDAEIDLLIYDICGSCTPSSGAPGGTGGTGGSVSQIPGYNPGSTEPLNDCLKKLQSQICTPSRLAGMNIAKAVLPYLRGLIPATSPVQPILKAYSLVIDAFLSFCANPTGTGAQLALSVVCLYWNQIKDVDPTSLGPTLGAAGGTLPSVLATVFDKELRDTITACCAALANLPPSAGEPAGGSTDANGNPPIPGLPPGTIPGVSDGVPAGTDPGTLVRPIVSAITQMAMGPESPLNNVTQSFLTQKPGQWPPKI